MNPARRMFHEIVQIGLEEGITVDSMARRFQAARTTVVRWANGKANPHPAIRKQIVWHIRDLGTSPALAKKIEDYFNIQYVCENCSETVGHLHTCYAKPKKD